MYYLRSYLIILIIAIIGSTPLFKDICNKLKQNKKFTVFMDILEVLYCFILLIIVTAFLIDASFNPFLYFRF